MKDAYWFKHDSNSRNDQKLISVRADHGMRGYGIFFGIIEILREANEYQISSNYKAIAYDLREPEEIIKEVVENYNLFEFDNGNFFSKSLKERMKKMDKIREKRSLSGRLGGEANAKQMLKQTISKRASKIKLLEERRVEEIRGDKKETKTTYPTDMVLKETSLLKVDSEIQKKEETPQASFVNSFKKTYEGMVNQPFKAGKEHYIMVAKLIKDHGLEAVILKAKLLGYLCENRSAWFTKSGWADYRLETLSKHWNSILEQDSQESKDRELLNDLRREEAKNAELNRLINGK